MTAGCRVVARTAPPGRRHAAGTRPDSTASAGFTGAVGRRTRPCDLARHPLDPRRDVHGVAGDPRLDRPQERERLDAGDDDRHRGQRAGDREQGEERARVPSVEAEQGVGAEDDRVRRRSSSAMNAEGRQGARTPRSGQSRPRRNSPSNPEIRDTLKLGLRGADWNYVDLATTNGGFPLPPAGEPVRVVDCHHPACAGDTRVRLPGVVPSRAVRRVVCQRCEQPYEPERVAVVSDRPSSPPRSRGVG